MNITLQSSKMIGAGLATIGLIGVGIGIGIFSSYSFCKKSPIKTTVIWLYNSWICSYWGSSLICSYGCILYGFNFFT
nr:Atp9 [Porphyridium purpureum]UBY46116.1 Atp9 [Porphyridium purpureum]